MNMKKCTICGFDLWVEQHHPDGKDWFYIVTRDKFETQQRYPCTDEWRDILNGSDVDYKRRRLHKYPDIWYYLCPNCHALKHQMDFSDSTIKTLYESRDINYKSSINIVKLIKDLRVLCRFVARVKGYSLANKQEAVALADLGYTLEELEVLEGV